jgi:hypothetical protein
MALNVKAGDIVRPKRLAILGVREDANDPPLGADKRLMIVYTGWIAVTHGAGEDESFETAVAFVPNGPGPSANKVEIQTWKEDDKSDLGIVEAVVTSALSGFGDEIDAAAVDSVKVELKHKNFPGIGGAQRFLVLTANLTAEDGAIKGISYQVTVLTHPGLLDTPLVVDKNEFPDQLI